MLLVNYTNNTSNNTLIKMYTKYLQILMRKLILMNFLKITQKR